MGGKGNSHNGVCAVGDRKLVPSPSRDGNRNGGLCPIAPQKKPWRRANSLSVDVEELGVGGYRKELGSLFWGLQSNFGSGFRKRRYSGRLLAYAG